MPTVRQTRLAKAIIENAVAEKPLNKKDLLVSAGYDLTTAEATPARVIEQKGTQQALADFGFTEENAKMVVSEILLDPETDKNTRINAAKEVFKVHGTYAPEKKLVGNFNLNEEQRDKAKSAIKNIAG